MKKTIGFCLVAALLACNDNANETPKEEETETVVTDSLTIEPFVPGSNPETKLFVWKASPDYTLTQNKEIPAAFINADTLIKGINEMNENVLLQKVKQSGDTLYTEIKDSDYLGNRMGSTGAEIYIADVVLNLTEVPGVRYVTINLQEQNHVQPGTWSKKNFEKYKPIN